MASASAAADIIFVNLTLAQLRQWVEDRPGRVEDRDKWGYSCLYAAALKGSDATLVEWMIDTHGADVNGRMGGDGLTALHIARTPSIIRALLKRHADPTLLDEETDRNALMHHVHQGRTDCVACLLEDKGVVGSVNSTGLEGGWSAIHYACTSGEISRDKRPAMLRLLLAAGADPHQQDSNGSTPFQLLVRWERADAATVAVLTEEFPDAQRAACLLYIRRLVIKKQGAELHANEDNADDDERKLAFVVGLGKDGGCQRDAFALVMDMLLPEWHPLRKGLGEEKKVVAAGDGEGGRCGIQQEDQVNV